jgi:hypothetical protein
MNILQKTTAAGITGFMASVAVATAVQPASYDSFRDYISGLAALDASYPWVMMAGFQFGAVGLVAAALLVYRRLPSIPGRISATLLLVAGVALSVAGFARFDCGHNDAACRAQIEAGMSFHSHLHGLAALVFFLPMVLAAFGLAVAVWRSDSPYRRRLSPTVLLWALVQFAITVSVEEQLVAQVGLLQRLDTLLVLGLPLLVTVGPWGFAAGRPSRERALVTAAA